MSNSVEIDHRNGMIEEIATAGHPSRLSSGIFFLLCFIPVLTTVLFGGVDNATWMIVTICWAAIILMWMAEAWRVGGLVFHSSSLQIPLIVLLLIGIFQLLPFGSTPGDAALAVPASKSLTFDVHSTRFFLSHLIVYIVFFAACLTYISNEKRLRRVVFLTIIFGACMAFVAILQRLASPDMIYGLRVPNQAVAFGPFINQHHFAAFMEMTGGLTLSLILARSEQRSNKPLLLICLAIMGIAGIMTGSRGGMISFIGVAGFVGAFHFLARRRDSGKVTSTTRPPLQKALLITGIGIVILVFIGSVVYLGGSDALLRGITMDVAKEDVSNGRLHFWWVAIQIFLAHPILGVGLEAFGVAFTKYDTWPGIFRVEQAHNEYLQILAETGIVGFACVSAFIYLLFRKGSGVIKKAVGGFRHSAAIGALGGCFGILIHSFFDFPLRTPSNGFFFLLLAAIATVTVSAKGVSGATRQRKRRSTSHSQ